MYEKRTKNEKKEKNNITLFTGRISESTKYDEIKINYAHINYDVMNKNLLAFFHHFPHFISVKSARTLCIRVCVFDNNRSVRVCVAWESCVDVSKTKFNLSLSVHTKENCQRWRWLMPVYELLLNRLFRRRWRIRAHIVCANIINAPVHVRVCVCAQSALCMCARLGCTVVVWCARCCWRRCDVVITSEASNARSLFIYSHFYRHRVL